MEIKGPKGPDKTGKTSKSKKSSSSSSAGEAFRSFLEEGGSDASIDNVASSSSAASVAPVDAILAMQGIDPEESRRNSKRQVERGHSVLDILDEVRVGILTGEISGNRLKKLQDLIEEQRGELDDPRLVELMDEIDLRAAVELAKLGY
ncbi:MAG: flagellar assembly protein FliX [Rickettsiales bacterium]|nr:flagellar assembly protein FliX [Rickettsiales bacterium]|tara:strand:- start:1067 stop:1510 length:444 start_codon:yes stop_codon:yes gene_type:complete